MKKTTSIILSLMLLCSLFTLVACQQSPASIPDKTPAQKSASGQNSEAEIKDLPEGQPLRPVKVILDYVINTNHSGLFLAKERGYYAEEGLDVEIIEPQEGVSLQILAAGKADFATSYQEDLTYALSLEEPLPLKAVAAVIQNNTSGFASLKEKNIKSPSDFEGKTYAGWGSASEKAIIQAAMQKAGLDSEKMEFVTAMDTSYASLSGNIDLMWFFEAWDMIAAAREGLELNYIPCRDIDERLNYYTPIVVAREDSLKSEPELVHAFMRATQRGYEAAADEANAKEIVDILLKYSPDLDPELLLESQRYLAKEYMKGVEHWGLMDDKVWTAYAEFMQEYELIDKVLPAQAYYTNEFLSQ